MPSSLVAVLIGYGVSQAAVAVVGVLAATVIGAATTFAVSSLLSSAFGKGSRSSLSTGNFAATAKGLTITSREAAAPWKIIYGQTRIGGVITFMEASTDNQNLWMVITIAGHPCQEYTAIWADDEVLTLDGEGKVTNTKYFNGVTYGIAFFGRDLGTTSGQPFPGLVSASDGKWSNDCTQHGRTKAYVSLWYSPEMFPTGVPNFSFIMKGKVLYDTRTSTYVWSDNSALCVYDYLTDTSYGMGIPPAEINIASFNAAANICDEEVDRHVLIGGVEKRYTCNGAFGADMTPEQILPQLLGSMGGRLTYTNGKYVIWAGAYVTPTLTLTESDLASGLEIVPLASKRDLFNCITGVFSNQRLGWQPDEYPVVRSESAINEDGGEEIWSNMDLPFTKSSATCMRLAKLALGRVRRQMTVKAMWKMRAYRLQVCDTVMLTFPKYGWSSKVFEVQDVGFSVSGGGQLGIELILRATDSNVYAWAAGEETIMQPAVSTNLPNPFIVQPPGAPTFSEELYETMAGVKTKLTVSWTATPDWFAQSGLSFYQLEYKEAGTSDWFVITNIKALAYQIIDLAPALYDWRIKAINVTGVGSQYTSPVQYRVLGLFSAPSNPTGFSVRPIAGVAYFQWDESQDVDVRRGGAMEVRHSSAGSPSWSDSALIDEFPGSAVQGYGALVLGTYMLRSRDSSHVYSNSYASFAATEALITGFTTVASVVEAPTFGGSKANLSVSGGTTLQLTTTTSHSGVYSFPQSSAAYPGYVDCGSAAPRRLELDIDMTRFDAGDLIDDRGPVDDWPNVDGGAVNEGNVIVYARRTNDNPSGAPTWSEWTEFVVAEFGERAFQFRADYQIVSDTNNIGVTELNVHIKKPG